MGKLPSPIPGNVYRYVEKRIRHRSAYLARALESLSESTDVLERDTVVLPRFHREACVGCGRCAVSCADGGHQAIRLGKDRKPLLDGKRCVGCHLCGLVCPERAITSSGRRISRG